MELTKEHFDQQLGKFVSKEYFDQQLGRFVTKEDLEVILDQKLDKRFGEFGKKMDEKFAAQTKELKEFAEEQTESLVRIIATTVAEPLEDVKSRVVAIEQRAYRAY